MVATVLLAAMALQPHAHAHPIDEIRSQALVDLRSADGRHFEATVFLERAHLEKYREVLQRANLPHERDDDELAETVRLALEFGDCRTAPRPRGERALHKAGGAWTGLRFALDCPPSLPTLTLTRRDYSHERTRTTLLWTVQIDGREPLEALLPPHLASLTVALDGSGVVRSERGLRDPPVKDSVQGASPADSVRGRDYVAVAGTARPPDSVLWAWLQEGALHLAVGIDHLLFLLTLVLAGRTLRGLLAGVTAFSVGHVGAMAAALWQGWSPLSWLDVVIGGTIAVSAWQARRRDGVPAWRLALTSLGFGLIHGLGFGSGLQQLAVGVDNLWWPLLSFGLGLDLAQLLWVAVTALLWRLALAGRDVARWTATVAWLLMAAGVLAGVWAWAAG
jgi:hypothetical protein